MNRPCSAPDVVQCSMCQTSVAPMYCEVVLHTCVKNVKKHIYLIRPKFIKLCHLNNTGAL